MAEPSFDALWDAAPAAPSSPSTGDFDALWEAAPAPSRRGAGSSGGINAGPAPAGEADQQPPSVGERAADLFIGAARSTPEVEAAPDIALMPEMRAATINRTLPGLGGILAPAVVTAEESARQIVALVKDGKDPEQAIKDFGSRLKGQLATTVGTLFTRPEETMQVLKGQYPDVEIRQDEKGNFFAKSPTDGKEYAIKPGLRASDAPQILQTAAALTPAGRVAGVLPKVAAAGVSQAGIEASQAATGGEFDAADVAATMVGTGLLAGGGAGISALKKNAAETAERVAAAKLANEARPKPDPKSLIDDVAKAVDGLTPGQKALLDEIPVLGKALRVARAFAKDKAAPAAKDVVDEGTEVLARDVVDAADNTLTDTVAARAGKGAAPTKVEGRPVPIEEPSASAVEPPTITPTPQPATAVGRARPRVAPQEPIVEPTETQTAKVPRPAPLTEGLDPTEIIEAPKPIPQTRARNLSDDEAATLLRKAAIDHGSLDVATLASKAGLSSSQTSRVLQMLVKKAAFRNAVAEAAAAKAPAPALPNPDLLEGVAAQNTGGKVTERTLRQEAAIQREAAQAVTIGDFANKLGKLPSEKRGSFLRMLAKDKGQDFANKVAKAAGITTKGI